MAVRAGTAHGRRRVASLSCVDVLIAHVANLWVISTGEVIALFNVVRVYHQARKVGGIQTVGEGHVRIQNVSDERVVVSTHFGLDFNTTEARQHGDVSERNILNAAGAHASDIGSHSSKYIDALHENVARAIMAVCSILPPPGFDDYAVVAILNIDVMYPTRFVLTSTVAY